MQSLKASSYTVYPVRSNGQSKGYCSIDLSSVESAKTLLNQLRNVWVDLIQSFCVKLQFSTHPHHNCFALI